MDIEKKGNSDELQAIPVPGEGGDQAVTGGRFRRIIDSFRPADLSEYDTEGLTAVEKAALATAKSPLNRELKSRHLQMIAIGASIGTGLFVGSGKALNQGGPASLLICFGVIGIMLFCTVHSLGEMAVAIPVSGSFTSYSTRFIGQSWAFAAGWVYCLIWFIVLPLELIAAAITIEYWNSPVNTCVFVAIFWFLIVIIGLFGVRGYAEAEFVLSLVKVVAVVGFIILGICLTCGASPNGQGYIGGKYWHDPGAFTDQGFHGFCSVFVTAAFSFTGTELVGLAAAETANPRKSLPAATKQVFVRLLVFYIVSLTIVGLLVPWDDPRLLSAESSADAKASPFVIAIENAGIKVLPSIFNVVILIAVLSVGNSALYAASRILTSLAEQGFAPGFVAYVDRAGRPLVGLVITYLFGLLSFLVASDAGSTVLFNWFATGLTGLPLCFACWGTINFAHIRWRLAYKAQGRDPKRELAYRSPLGIYGSIVGVIINFIILIAQFYTALYPVGGPYLNVEIFFQQFLAVPIFIVLYVGHKIIVRPRRIRLKEADLDTGRRELDMDLLAQEIEEEEARIKAKGWWYRVYKIFF